MKYYVLIVSNGNLVINSITEWSTLDSAKGKFHEVCALYWKDASVTDATIAIVDSQLNTVDGCREAIHKA